MWRLSVSNKTIRGDDTVLYLDDDGKRHNDDGPAVLINDRYSMTSIYYQSGKLHRENGPACITDDKVTNRITNVYYMNNKCHRLFKPACISVYRDSLDIISYDYYINGRKTNKVGCIVRSSIIKIINLFT